MAIIWIPALMRDLTGGLTQVDVPGTTVREVIESLEIRFPGVKARLVEEGRLRPNITVIVDGTPGQKRLRQPVSEHSEIHFIPSMSGGSGRDSV
jgi:molybdopterin synthase sulfur carrier subunit